MPLEEKNFYEFGCFCLKPSERLLLQDHKAVSLPPKAFETLLLLVRNSGHVLSKDELMKSLWPDTFVEENNLTQHISLLRRALGEGANGDRYIETVPKLGYRFAVPVREVSDNSLPEVWQERRTRTHIVIHEQEVEETVEAGTSEHPAATRQAVRPATKPATIWKWLTLVIVAVTGLAAAYLLTGRFRKPQQQGSHARTLAVLPFRDLKPGADTQYLSYSLADAIISRLGYFPGVIVRPSSYVARYRGGEADPRSAAKELHAEVILTGNYIQEGDRLRVSTELVDVTKDQVLWRDTLEVPSGQLLTVQDRVAEKVARGMSLQVLPQTAEHLRDTAPRNSLAYEYLLRGWDSSAQNGYAYSIRMLEKSVELDPAYAPAWMELGIGYANYAIWNGGGAEFMAKSQAAYDKALRLDPQIPVLHALLAIHMVERGELEKGLLTLREELRLNPNEAAAHWWLSAAYLYGGMLEESIAEGERALKLDPLVNVGSTFNSYLHAGDYAEFLSTMPTEGGARTTFYRGLCFYYQRDNARAAAEFERAYATDPSLLHAKFGEAFLYAIRNQPAEGRQYLKKLEADYPPADGEMLYKMAQAYASLGDTPSALRLLRQTIDHNFYCYACFLRDPLIVSLHGEPQYVDLMNLARQRHENFKRQYF
jgi:DNA-binding winged helix-turn-helix (wHTH) protein/TolB-like protein/Tfp pilus assembly protein PilF